MTARVGEIGADTATIARHLATLRTRIRFPYRGAEEGVILGILGDRLQPRRPAQLRATPLNAGRSRRYPGRIGSDLAEDRGLERKRGRHSARIVRLATQGNCAMGHGFPELRYLG